MSLLRSLLSLVVVVCIAPLCTAQWPCPDDSVIYPCTCTSNDDFEITMDCSYIESSAALAKVFETPFAFNDLKKLYINQDHGTGSLEDLPAGVFGPVNFQEIEIINTDVNIVEEETLVNSHDTLVSLTLYNNRIAWFPFETLKLFTEMTYLDLSYNMFVGVMPDIETVRLISLDFSGNTGFTLTQTSFIGSTSLKRLYLTNMGLGDTTPPNVFQMLTNLSTLNLQNNDIPGTLIEDFINMPPLYLDAVNLDGNSISQIHPLSVTGLSDGGTLSFRSNQIQYLWEDNWGGLVSRLNANAIDMTNNPLVCGCDVYYLVKDETAMAVFDNMTTCVTGNYMEDLPLVWFNEHCS